MKIAVMIMSTKAQPSLRNVETFENTVVKYYNENRETFKNVFDFYVYYSNDEQQSGTNENAPVIKQKENGVYDVCIAERESIYRTYEKTYYMFKSLDKEKYDLFIRINISLWLNLRLLDCVADQFRDDCVYCNSINSYTNAASEYVNDLYPRGDMYIFGRETMSGILKFGEKYLYCDQSLKDRMGIDHVDDCIIGICLIDTYGKYYYRHLVALRYTFAPGSTVRENGNIDRNSIGFRVKTTPAGAYSGYSWDDNEYRLKDVDKMKELQDYFDNEGIRYDGVRLENLFTDATNEKPALFVQAKNYGIKNVFWKFLEMKRK